MTSDISVSSMTSERPLSSDIWVWAERQERQERQEQQGDTFHDAVRELLGEARELADALGGRVAAVVLGSCDDAALSLLVAGGADRVYVLDGGDLNRYDTEPYVAALAGLVVAEGPPAALLCAQTANGADLAPRLAARLGFAYLGDCIWLRPEGAAFRATRPAYDDRVYQEWLLPAGVPCVVAYRVGVRGEAPLAADRRAEVMHRAASASEVASRVRHLRTIQPEIHDIGLEDADRVVAAGLGVGSRECLGEVRQLADLLGAALGASRPLADRGWVPFERQIGTTGRSIAPKLYVALGISGAVQHIAGIANTETIIAVNTDRGAPMMALATLAAVGKVEEVVPLLIARLRERAAQSARFPSPEPAAATAEREPAP